MQRDQTPSRTEAPPVLAGAIRRFGPHGILYEVLELTDRERARIRVIETGEEITYPISSISADPPG
jgi:hypothetical protein